MFSRPSAKVAPLIASFALQSTNPISEFEFEAVHGPVLKKIDSLSVTFPALEAKRTSAQLLMVLHTFENSVAEVVLPTPKRLLPRARSTTRYL
jgi:hypothetical protein